MKCQVQLGNTGARPCPGSCLPSLAEFPCSQLSLSSSLLCSTRPLPFSQLHDIEAGHSLFIFIDDVLGEAHGVILSHAEHPRIFAFHIPLCWVLFGMGWGGVEKMTSSSPSKKDTDMANVSRCCLIPIWTKCLVYPMFPGQRAQASQGPLLGPICDSLLFFQALPLEPSHTHASSLPHTAPSPFSITCFPLPRQCSLDALLMCFFLKFFLLPHFHLFPCLLFLSFFKRTEVSFFLRVESSGSSSLLNREGKSAL